MTTGIVWFRQDLRLSDNPAFERACRECDRVLPVFIDDPTAETISQVGAASRVWLHHSLDALGKSLRERDSDLYLLQGEPGEVLQQCVESVGATAVFWNRCYDPVSQSRDRHLKAALVGARVHSANGILLTEPDKAVKADGSPYRVYTPFFRNLAAQDLPERAPLPKPKQRPSLPTPAPESLPLERLGLLPARDWHSPMMSHWAVGEKAARKQLLRFLDRHVSDYKNTRDVPGVAGTSQLSPHLHFGEISPRQIVYETKRRFGSLDEMDAGPLTFVKEVCWREFGYHLLHHFPDTVTEPMDRRFAAFPWTEDPSDRLLAWQEGRTGVPIVDAGMRELYATGWMHNRVRMIVASYLIKNLLVSWQSGEAWFRDTLVDADIASNTLGWQWTAGCGADAAPFFRVFNPVLQGEKFDAQGEYVRRWVPELKSVSTRFLHKPWEMPDADRQGLDYPDPLVDLRQSRQRALEAFDRIKSR